MALRLSTIGLVEGKVQVMYSLFAHKMTVVTENSSSSLCKDCAALYRSADFDIRMRVSWVVVQYFAKRMPSWLRAVSQKPQTSCAEKMLTIPKLGYCTLHLVNKGHKTLFCARFCVTFDP